MPQPCMNQFTVEVSRLPLTELHHHHHEATTPLALELELEKELFCDFSNR